MPAAYREPLCAPGVLPRARWTAVHLGRRYPAVFARTGSCAPPPSSRRFQPSPIRRVLAGCCGPLLQDGGSRRYLHEPCTGAWTPTPPRSAGAFTRFFPADIGLTAHFTGSARETLPAMQLQRGGFFRGCSHSFIFRLPCSLDPLAAPTAEARFPPGGWAVYTTQWMRGYPSKLWHHYTPESGNWSGRTSTCWFMALPAATKMRKPSPLPVSFAEM